MRSSLSQPVITKVNIIQSLLNKNKKVPTLYLIKFQVLCSVSSCYNFAMLTRSLCSSAGCAVQLRCVSAFPYGEPCLQQHIALLSGVLLLFPRVLYASFTTKASRLKGEIEPLPCGPCAACLTVLHLWRSKSKRPWKWVSVNVLCWYQFHEMHKRFSGFLLCFLDSSQSREAVNVEK